MENKGYYPKEEIVVEILDTAYAPHVYIFGNGMLDAKSKFEAAANKRSGAFIKGRATSDRQGDSAMVNASRVNKFKTTRLRVPTRIEALIDELATSEDEARIAEIDGILRDYYRY